jgi:hypothetical protein
MLTGPIGRLSEIWLAAALVRRISRKWQLVDGSQHNTDVACHRRQGDRIVCSLLQCVSLLAADLAQTGRSRLSLPDLLDPYGNTDRWQIQPISHDRL